MKYLLIFFSLDSFMKKAILSALFYSGKYRFLLLRQPFSKLAPALGKSGEKKYVYTEAELHRAYLIGRAIAMVCRHTPWQSLCLVQAFTAHAILTRQKIPCNVYFGVRSIDHTLAAHAWTKCDELFITGSAGHELFTVTGVFHS